MRNRINHITKLEFLPCFIAAFKDAITKSNIQGVFQGARLVPLDAEAVISKLDVRLRTPTPPTTNVAPWVSKPPSNTLEFGSQVTLIRERIQRHVDSLPTHIVEAVKKLAKGAEIMAHSLVLMSNQVKELQAANEAASRRKAANSFGVDKRTPSSVVRVSSACTCFLLQRVVMGRRRRRARAPRAASQLKSSSRV